MRSLTALLLLIVLFGSARLFAAEEKYEIVSFPAGLEHDAWDGLLKKYVGPKGLVDYAAWKKSADDMKALNDYLASFGPAPEPAAKGPEMIASAINAYNAFAIKTILEHYPVKSIKDIEKAFSKKSHRIGGQDVSLDDLENGTLRPEIGYRAHAVLVCCALSCPPLQRFAYVPGKLDGQIDEAYRTWLAREDLNRYLPDENKVKVSKIFDWYGEDFKEASGLPRILARYGPKKLRDFLAGDYQIEFLPYDWALNDQAGN